MQYRAMVRRIELPAGTRGRLEVISVPCRKGQRRQRLLVVRGVERIADEGQSHRDGFPCLRVGCVFSLVWFSRCLPVTPRKR